jgi:hypothetical protein
MIPAYSPQARGRGERNFRTWQGRLPQELRLRGITTLEAANTFIRDVYLKQFNASFTVPAAELGTAFAPVSAAVNLNRIFSIQHERTVNADNTVRIGNLVLQIQPVGWRATLAKSHVWICEQLDGTFTVTYGPHVLGRYDHDGDPIIEPTSSKGNRSVQRRRIAALSAVGGVRH